MVLKTNWTDDYGWPHGADLNAIATQVNTNTTDVTARQTALSATAVKTSAYTAAAGDLIPVDATAGAVTITLSSTPTDKDRVVVKKIDASANAVTINRGGSTDVFNAAAGSTSLTLSLQFQAVQLQYKASGGIWYVVSTDVPLGGLDTRYQPLDSDLTAFAAKTAPTGAVVGTTDTQTVTNKDLTAATNTFPTSLLTTSSVVVDSVRDNPTAAVTSIPRLSVISNAISNTSQLLRLTYFTAPFAFTVSNLSLTAGTAAAAATPTLIRYGIYSEDGSGNLTLIGSTPNDTTMLAAAFTAYTKALSTPVALTKGTRYAMAVLVVSSATMHNMYGISVTAADFGLAPRLTAAVAAQTDLPSTVAVGSLANNAMAFYMRGT